MGDLCESFEVEGAWVGGCASDQHLRLRLGNGALDAFPINEAVIRTHAIKVRREPLPRDVDGCAVRKVAALREAHGNERIAWLHQRIECGDVRGSPRVRLHIDMFTPGEELQRAGASEIFNGVNVFTPCVVALPWISLSVFVGENCSLRFAHGGVGVIL